MGNEEKLDKVLEVIVRLAGVMETTLHEVKASNRSRWIIMFSMLGMLLIFGGVTYVVLDKIYAIIDQQESSQLALATEAGRLDELIDLAKKNASTPQMEQKLQRLQSRKVPTPKNLIRALSVYRPELILEAAEQIRAPADSNSDGGTDGRESY